MNFKHLDFEAHNISFTLKKQVCTFCLHPGIFSKVQVSGITPQNEKYVNEF